MNWSDEGLVLGCRPYGESSVVLELMTRARGRHLGLVRGGRSRRLRAVLQAGNGVSANWRARLDEQLGAYEIEAGAMRAARFMDSPLALYGLATLAGHLRLLPERDPHPDLYEAATIVVEHLAEPEGAAALLVRFELLLLTELGFGLDLSACAATGQTEDLLYVSPRTGRAVGRLAGEPYRERLLGLPGFLLDETAAPAAEQVAAGFRLTGHFLTRHVYEPRKRPEPEERVRLVALAAGGDLPRRAGPALSAKITDDTSPGADSAPLPTEP